MAETGLAQVFERRHGGSPCQITISNQDAAIHNGVRMEDGGQAIEAGGIMELVDPTRRHT